MEFQSKSASQRLKTPVELMLQCLKVRKEECSSTNCQAGDVPSYLAFLFYSGLQLIG